MNSKLTRAKACLVRLRKDIRSIKDDSTHDAISRLTEAVETIISFCEEAENTSERISEEADES